MIAHEWCWNALAKHADIVLPCTTTLERTDIAMSPMDNYFVSMEAAIAPVGDSRDDLKFSEAFLLNWAVRIPTQKGVAPRIGNVGYMMLLNKHLPSRAMNCQPMMSFVITDGLSWNRQGAYVMLADFRADPAANPLATPSGKIEIAQIRLRNLTMMIVPPSLLV